MYQVTYYRKAKSRVDVDQEGISSIEVLGKVDGQIRLLYYGEPHSDVAIF